VLNPRRSNIWLQIAVAKQKAGKSSQALEAMWLAWQFSSEKQRMLDLLDKKILEEPDSDLKIMYTYAKAWVLEGKKPTL
jgi:hypothetical protein